MRRDRLTFAMMVGMPIVQLVLFGFAINTDPKALPTAMVDRDDSGRSRAASSPRCRTPAIPRSRARPRAKPTADALLARGERAVRGRDPARLLATHRARRAAGAAGRGRRDRSRGDRQRARGGQQVLGDRRCCHDLTGPLARCSARTAPFEVRVQRRYNPEGITQYNIVPGLIGVILHDDDGDDDRRSP